MSEITISGRMAAESYRAKQAPMSTFDQSALVAGAAQRRARLQEIEAAMEHACEAAVGRVLPRTGTGARVTWDRNAWQAYVAEAINQSRQYRADLARLRRDLDHLEHLARCMS